MKQVCAILLSFSLLSCGKPSPAQSYAQARAYLDQAGSIYSTIADTEVNNAKSQADSLPYGQKADDKLVMRLGVAAGIAGDSKECSEAVMTLLNFEAQEKLKETPSKEEYEKLIQTLDDLFKRANNFANNPKMAEAIPAVERLELRRAQSLIKQAYDLVSTNPPIS